MMFGFFIVIQEMSEFGIKENIWGMLSNSVLWNQPERKKITHYVNWNRDISGLPSEIEST